MYVALKPTLPVKLNYLIVPRKRTQKGHKKSKLSLFKIWTNICGMLLALFAQLFLTLWWYSILNSVVPMVPILTQHLPPRQDRRQAV